jgi:hypothetical protein
MDNKIRREQDMQEKNKMVDLQVYNSQPQKMPTMIAPEVYRPIYNYGPYGPHGQGPYHPYWMRPNDIPVIKNYKINTSGPLDKHENLAVLYEDILPTKKFPHTHNTVNERIAIYNFVRAVLIRNGDGENISFEEDGDAHNLVRYIKFMDLNPYNNSDITMNPYKDLPKDMLIYRSCYPIRYDPDTGAVSCARNSIGVNVRIYKMSYGEYSINKHGEDLGVSKQTGGRYIDYDLWREVGYYEFVREEIIKKKLCPNFTCMYSYHVYENCKIDFEKLNQLRGIRENQYRYQAVPRGGEGIDMVPQDRRLGIPNQIPLNTNYQPQQDTTAIDGRTLMPLDFPTLPNIPNIPQFQVENLAGNAENVDLYDHPDAFSGRALVVLTESPNQTLYGWASRTYMSEGKIRRMISTGYHDDNVWYSILFQLMVAMYVMQIKEINFANFSMENNVYVKDISYNDKAVNFWKYAIDGFEYFIPNYGYVVMIDSNFKDVDEELGRILGRHRQDGGAQDSKFKIRSNIYGQDGGYRYANMDSEIFDSFAGVFTPNAFSREFTNKGGNKPSQEVIEFLSIITADVRDSGYGQNRNIWIGDYIKRHMARFLHNRVGTKPTVDERTKIEDDIVKDCKPGKIYAQMVGHDNFVYVIFGEYDDNGRAFVITKQRPNSRGNIIASIPADSLRECTKYEQLKQDYRPGFVNLAETELLETYTINGSD